MAASRLIGADGSIMCVGITAAVVSADIVNLSATEILALTTDLRGVCYGNTDIYYGSPRTPEILDLTLGVYIGGQLLVKQLKKFNLFYAVHYITTLFK